VQRKQAKDSHEILSSVSPHIMLSPIGGAESKKQQALERESSCKLNATSISGTFPASHSLTPVSYLLVFIPFSCDSTAVCRTVFWTGL